MQENSTEVRWSTNGTVDEEGTLYIFRNGQQLGQGKISDGQYSDNNASSGTVYCYQLSTNNELSSGADSIQACATAYAYDFTYPIIEDDRYFVELYESADHIAFHSEAIHDVTDDMSEFYPDTDFMSIDIDVDRNKKTDEAIDIFYSIGSYSDTGEQHVCAGYRVSEEYSYGCGSLHTYARLDGYMSVSERNSVSHTTWDYRIPKDDFYGAMTLNARFGFYSKDDGFTYYPVKQEDEARFENTLAVNFAINDSPTNEEQQVDNSFLTGTLWRKSCKTIPPFEWGNVVELRHVVQTLEFLENGVEELIAIDYLDADCQTPSGYKVKQKSFYRLASTIQLVSGADAYHFEGTTFRYLLLGEDDVVYDFYRPSLYQHVDALKVDGELLYFGTGDGDEIPTALDIDDPWKLL